IARALREAHRMAVIHRDLKPGNITVVRGGDDYEPDLVKVFDFGLVMLLETSDGKPDVTRQTALIASPPFSAPSQRLGEPIDARAEIYSFGAGLYSMVAGVAPFMAENARDLLRMHLPNTPELISDTGYKRECTPALEGLIFKCLEKLPDDRLQSMAEV